MLSFAIWHLWLIQRLISVMFCLLLVSNYNCTILWRSAILGWEGACQRSRSCTNPGWWVLTRKIGWCHTVHVRSKGICHFLYNYSRCYRLVISDGRKFLTYAAHWLNWNCHCFSCIQFQLKCICGRKVSKVAILKKHCRPFWIFNAWYLGYSKWELLLPTASSVPT